MIKDDLSKYKETFLGEAKEHLEAMSAALLKLEKDLSNEKWVSAIFHEAHTLKSMAAAMGYDKAAELCHALEDVLESVKGKKVAPERCVDILFECLDNLGATLRNIKENKEECDAAGLVKRLGTLAAGGRAELSGTKAAEEETTATKIESIEVKVERLDQLMNLAEELLINKMRLDKIREEIRHPELAAALDILGRLVGEIQYNIMQSRLVPIGFVFNRFPRLVRDLAKNQKKDVTLEMEGGDIELDRSVIDEIGESLLHLVRNAVDHGIELPETRRRAGKDPSAKLRLSATRTKSYAVIKVVDDGAGLDVEDIRNVAVQRGLLSPQAGQEDVVRSIFSGVSTTRQVTAVSGRGFGLSIVKHKIESIGGEIAVGSEPKKGTTFTIKIPLTLAVIKSLFVKVGDKVYAVPLVNIERLVSVDRKDVKAMMGHEAVVLNNEDILITRLDELFAAPLLKTEKQALVIVWKGTERLGLAVDGFLTTQDIVIKPLNKLVRENKYFAGSTIIGSGEVVLILDVANLPLSKTGRKVGKGGNHDH